MNENTRGSRLNGGAAPSHVDEFITLQDAAKEFGIYPSVMRVWEREGRLPVGSVNNMRVRRFALINAIEADAKAAALANAPAARPEDGEIALARRIVRAYESGDHDAFATLASEAKAILERLNTARD